MSKSILNTKMKNLILFALITLNFACVKDEECVVITDKKEMNRGYYFFFHQNQAYSGNSSQMLESDLNSDGYASGKVDENIFLKNNIGDEYCF